MQADSIENRRKHNQNKIENDLPTREELFS